MFFTRGEKHLVERFIEDLRGKYLKVKRSLCDDKNADGEYTEGDHLSLGVRPIQLWEVIYPKEHEKVIMKTIFHHPDTNPESKPNWFKRHRKYLDMIRIALKLKKIPKIEETDKKLLVANAHIEILGIGIKEDARDKNGVETL